MDRLLGVRPSKPPSGATTLAYGLEGLVVTACGSGYTGEYPSCLPNPTPIEFPSDGSSSGFWEGGGSGAPPPDDFTPELANDTVPPGVIPDCTQPQVLSWARAYCRAAPPTAERRVRTDSAIARVARRGSECATIAQAARDLQAAGRLQYYDSLVGDGAGGWGDPGIGVLISTSWIDIFGNTGNPNLSTFDRVFVHEVEHAMGREHIDDSGTDTPNSRECSRAP